MATRDQIYQGQLAIWQPDKREGYRFNIDSLLLAGFALRDLRPDAALCELGSGSAVIGLAMLFHGKALTYQGIERQADLAQLAKRSVEEAGFTARAKIIEGDLRELALPEASADAVLFNPPYFKAGSGRSSSVVGRREAREALHGDIEDFFEAAVKVLRPDGKLFAVLRPERRREAMELAKDVSLSIDEVCEVVTVMGGKHQLDLYRFTKTQPTIEPSFITLPLHRVKGSRAYTEAIEAFLSGNSSFLAAEAFSSKA